MNASVERVMDKIFGMTHVSYSFQTRNLPFTHTFLINYYLAIQISTQPLCIKPYFYVFLYYWQFRYL